MVSLAPVVRPGFCVSGRVVSGGFALAPILRAAVLLIANTVIFSNGDAHQRSTNAYET